MANLFHKEGRIWLQQVAWSEEQSVPANFYAGLADDVLLDADGLAQVGAELSGNGYARQPIASNNTDCVHSTDGVYEVITFKQVVFTADGGAWAETTRWFLGTTINNTGKLLLSGDISPGRTLQDDDSLKLTVTFRIKQT